MCGIAGYSLGGVEHGERPELSKVLRALHHRGPDGHGIYTTEDRTTGLAHVRLSIFDLSETGSQPMQSDDSRFVLSYNGEIYNFRTLRSELEEEGHTFRGTSDTEVLLKLLQLSGERALPKLNGMFAFALYDAALDQVTVVRDAYGVKPLYFAEKSNAVFFSSEIRGILAMGVDPDPPSAEALGNYMSFLWNPDVSTPAANIRSLRPGEAMVISRGAVVRRWIWFKSPILSPKVASGSRKELISETLNKVRSAVHRQMDADVPVGAFLSGGLDSSAVVALARERAPDIACFTIDSGGRPEDGVADDLPYAQRVADHLDVPLEVVRMNPEEMVRDLESMVWHLEEPLADPACLNVLYISRLARKQGLKVLLSGTGGDDLFTGYRRHRAIALDRYLLSLPAILRSGLERFGSQLDVSRTLNRRLAKFLRDAGSDGVRRLIGYFVWTRREDVLELCVPSLRIEMSGLDFTSVMQAYLGQAAESIEPLNQALALEQRFFLAEHNLLYTDKMSMASSIEVRVPFLDLELAEYAATLPVNVKQRGKEGKWILKKALEPLLPQDVIYRPKTGFGAPLRHWLRGDLAVLMNDLLSVENLNHRGIFDATAVRRLVSENNSGRKDASYTILSLMCIEIWCRLFLDNKCALA